MGMEEITVVFTEMIITNQVRTITEDETHNEPITTTSLLPAPLKHRLSFSLFFLHW